MIIYCVRNVILHSDTHTLFTTKTNCARNQRTCSIDADAHCASHFVFLWLRSGIVSPVFIPPSRMLYPAFFDLLINYLLEKLERIVTGALCLLVSSELSHLAAMDLEVRRLCHQVQDPTPLLMISVGSEAAGYFIQRVERCPHLVLMLSYNLSSSRVGNAFSCLKALSI